MPTSKLKQDVNIKLPSFVNTEDLIAFTQMFFLLKKANFTNIRALTSLWENTTKPAMKGIVEDILNGVEAGEYIYSTMEYYSRIFPPIYISIIKVGELSGSLADSLKQALIYLEENEKIKRTVRKALVGPFVQAAVLITIAVVAAVVGLPVMQSLYGELGVEDRIPKETLAFSNFITWMGVHWYVPLFVFLSIAGLFTLWKSTPRGRYAWDMFKLKMPVFGPLIIRLQLQKFFKAMQINLANNSRLQDAIEVSKNVTKNYVFLAALETAQNNLQVGASWIEPFEEFDFFPPMILEMLRIGMETEMTEMIDKIQEFIDEDIQITMGKITKALPEISYVFLGIVLIGFVLVVLKPIMEVYLGAFLFDAYGM